MGCGDEAVRGAPRRKMRPVGLVGAQRGGGGGLARERLGGGERGRAGLGRCGLSNGEAAVASGRMRSPAGKLRMALGRA